MPISTDMLVITSVFYALLGFHPSQQTINQIQSLLASGASATLIVAALEYTVKHSQRPTWQYAEAVVRYQLAAGITTGAQFNPHMAAPIGWQKRKKSPSVMRFF